MIRVKIPIPQIEKLRDDSEFILILRLGRFINQLAFLQDAYLSKKEEDLDKSPEGIRYAHNSFFFLCGVLFEALEFFPTLGKEFRGYKTYANGFGRLSKDPDLVFLKKHRVLKGMRNKFTFHVDAEPFEVALETYNIRLIKFILASGPKAGQIYYNLSDELVLNYYIGDHGTAEEEQKVQVDIMKRVLNVLTAFSKCSHSLIGEYMERKLWKGEEDD